MIVLGLNAFGHDAAAVLLVDGRVVFASSQERYDRARHSAAFPREAAAAALAHAGVEAADLDAVAFPWTRGMARWRKAWHVLRGLPRSRAYFQDPPDSLLPSRQGYLQAMRGLERTLQAEGFDAPLHRIPHHLAHAASAALALPDGTGGILTADGMGEWTTAAMWHADAHELSRGRCAVYPDSPGKAYAAVTQWLGFVPESDEGKTMGLAGYGTRDSEPWAFTHQLLEFNASRLLRIDRRSFGFPWGEARLYGDAFIDALGAARREDEPLRAGDADAALGIQDAVTTWGALVLRALREGFGEEPVGLAGGLFLNCAMNGELLKAGFDVRPFPVAGDAGAAWGAAAEVHRRLTGTAAEPLGSLYLGHAITEAEARAVAEREAMQRHDVDALALEVAKRIAAGEILAVARGRAEFGPRALGNRSVLASPTTTASRDRVNALKGREDWRPLAPIVREEDTRWFEGQVASRYMILTFDATERAKAEIPGVVHVDGTARVQTVAEGENDFVRAVLDALEALGEPPVVINTSLNRRGEPIVNTAEQALTAARAMQLDGVVIGDWIFPTSS
ncbi:MAG: carbamoyltransferase C-terminal domain-containing protein [Planctomycetota bacterium]|nr:carbamoyltransferase C-terminal domain-containing protein [Planctomycetota bacterium]